MPLFSSCTSTNVLNLLPLTHDSQRSATVLTLPRLPPIYSTHYLTFIVVPVQFYRAGYAVVIIEQTFLPVRWILCGRQGNRRFSAVCLPSGTGAWMGCLV